MAQLSSRTQQQKTIAELTIVVNNQNPYTQRLAHIPLPPAADDPDSTERDISSTALWDLARIKAIAERHSDERPTLLAITRRCRKDWQRLTEEPGGFDLAEHIRMLTDQNYQKSIWCKASPSGRVPEAWLPCDAYSLSVPFVHPVTRWSGTVNYYFKLCESMDGQLLLFVSVHP